MTFSLDIYYDKLSDLGGEYNLLNHQLVQFKSKTKLIPCIGAEIEFYLDGQIDLKMLKTMEKATGYVLKKEKGKNQYEIELPPSNDLASYARQIVQVREGVIHAANKLGARADFSSKPYEDDYGNSMHIHLNFQRNEDSAENKGEDGNKDIEKYARILCHYLPETIEYYLPKPEDYRRLDSKFMAPTHISYGGNNRTLLIRIPDSKPKRLEHRLPAANANPAHVIYAMLQSIDRGLQHPGEISSLKKTFGNAFDPQYGLERIGARKLC